MARATIKGLPRLKAKLERLRTQTASDVAPAMGRAAQLIVDMMKRQVPVHEGDLRDSIGWTFGDAPKGALTVASSRVGTLRVTIFAGDEKAFYARYIEFGTAPHAQGGKFAGTEHPGTPAQPFFFTSYRALRKEVKRMLRKAISEAVVKAIK